MRLRAAALGVVVASLAALAVAASPAAAKQACWNAVVQDWFDNGRIDKVYDPSCYEQAIAHLPSDVRYYSDAPNVIRRALQAVLLDRRASQQQGKTTEGDTNASGAAVAPGNGGHGGGPSGGGGKPVKPAPNTGPPTRGVVGSKASHQGPLPEAISNIGPKKADSFPVPLIVLAAIALLLLAAGGLGFVARRRQSRRLRAIPAPEHRALEP